jgi:shikimate 5-dehydrogenase
MTCDLSDSKPIFVLGLEANSYMVVFDTVYNPESTLLVKQAREIGCRTVTGCSWWNGCRNSAPACRSR